MISKSSHRVLDRQVVLIMGIILAVMAFGLRLLVTFGAPTAGDETYYWLWSRRLDWAYYDHPAGVALLIKLSAVLDLQGMFGLRWLNMVLGLSCIPLIYLVGLRLHSKRAGVFAACIVAVSAPYILVSGIVYTDTLHLFFMLVNIWSFNLMSEERSRTPQPSKTRNLFSYLLWGISLAFLFNTKYSAYLYAAGLSVVIILHYRWLLHEWRFWLAVLIGGIGLLPVMLWNATHEWASFRWQLHHLISYSPGSDAGAFILMPIRNLWHALGYITWPVWIAVLPAFVLFLQRRSLTPAEHLLLILSVTLLLPVIISPANSPRNLTSGLMFLFLLSGTSLTRLPSSPVRVLTFSIIFFTLVYGVGTTAALLGINFVPASTVVSELRYDAAGMQNLDQMLADYSDPIFTMDYQLASWLVYSTKRPAFSGWEQYRIWGIPELDRVTILSLGYLPDRCVTDQLATLFGDVSEPQVLDIVSAGMKKELHIWQVANPHYSSGEWAQRLDYLTLWESCG